MKWKFKKYIFLLINLIILIVLLIFWFTRILEISVTKKYQLSKVMPEFVKMDRTRKILLWNSFYSSQDYGFGFGVDPFFKAGCPQPDCFLTNDKSWIPIEYYDAIIFHGPQHDPEDVPSYRIPRQRYVYFSMESPLMRPMSHKLNYFFNWTMTYRLDSDLVTNYFNIIAENGSIVSPSENPSWNTRKIDAADTQFYLKLFANKTKPIAWFVSNCNSRNKREILVNQLKQHLRVDIYGKCGELSCPWSKHEECQDMLNRDYYFYLSFENSNCADYITEKVVTAMKNYVIPIVLNGANLTKFLPPHSYIDATQMSVIQLAMAIDELMHDSNKYIEYFWWKSKYQIVTMPKLPFCKLCEMLHDESLPEKSYNIVNWWHGTVKNPKCFETHP